MPPATKWRFIHGGIKDALPLRRSRWPHGLARPVLDATAKRRRCYQLFAPIVANKASRSAVAPKIRLPENLGPRLKYGLAAIASVVY
jgi:hypothetical protein